MFLQYLLNNLVMEILVYTIIWASISCLFAMILLSNNPYVKAHKIANAALERIEILKHKWLESEKAGRDIGMKTAQKSWSKNHAKKWKASRR
jgi:hypothetical protein